MEKIKFYSIVIMCMLLACRKSGPGSDLVPYVNIRYVDSSGNDIFSPSHDGQNGYWMDSVRLYDYKGGTKTLIYIASNGYVIYGNNPYGYSFTTYSNISNIPGEYMVISPDNDVVNRYSTFIINLKQGVYDTMKVHLTGNTVAGSQYDSVWYNRQYEADGRGGGLMTIIK